MVLNLTFSHARPSCSVGLPSAQLIGGRLEEKKTLFIGDTGNTAEVIEENRAINSEIATHTRNLVRQAGLAQKPESMKYLGSAVVHYYQKESFLNQDRYAMVCQTDVGDVIEQHADLGWKQLKTALMKAYGRKDFRRK